MYLLFFSHPLWRIIHVCLCIKASKRPTCRDGIFCRVDGLLSQPIESSTPTVAERWSDKTGLRCGSSGTRSTRALRRALTEGVHLVMAVTPALAASTHATMVTTAIATTEKAVAIPTKSRSSQNARGTPVFARSPTFIQPRGMETFLSSRLDVADPKTWCLHLPDCCPKGPNKLLSLY